MRDEALFSSLNLREGVIVNAVWQFIAQFSRRYGRDYFFTFEQIHPGISIGGYLDLIIHTKNDKGQPHKKIGLLEFHIGGPVAGRLIVGTLSNPADDNYLNGRNSLVCALLSSSYLEFYEKIVREFGLPSWQAKVPKANRFAISTQFISLVQNSLSIYPGEFRPMCGSSKNANAYTSGVADFHSPWAYQYFDEKCLPGPNFVGRPDEEISSLFSILPFDDLAGSNLHFVLHTSEARIRLSGGCDLDEHIDIANIYRTDRKKFVEFASSVAFDIFKKTNSAK